MLAPKEPDSDGVGAAQRPQSRAGWEWLIAGLWLAVIAIESTDLLSSRNTSRFLYPLLTFFFGHIDPAKFWYWHGIARKAGHVLGYGVLSVLLFRAWKATFPAPSRWSLQWARLAFAMTALTASLDEWHQSFSPARTGTMKDVLLDSAAGAAALLLVYVVQRYRASSPAAA